MLTDGSRDGRRCHSPITWEEGLDDKSFGLALLMIGKVQTLGHAAPMSSQACGGNIFYLR